MAIRKFNAEIVGIDFNDNSFTLLDSNNNKEIVFTQQNDFSNITDFIFYFAKKTGKLLPVNGQFTIQGRIILEYSFIKLFKPQGA